MTYLELYHQLTVLDADLDDLRRAVCADPIAGPFIDGQFQRLVDRLDTIIAALPTIVAHRQNARTEEHDSGD